MTKLFETQSYVSTEAAWHQELTFDEPYDVTVLIENLGADPIYGFYLNEADFEQMIANESVDDAIMSRLVEQVLCENECGVCEINVRFHEGKHFVCIELDRESKPDADRTEFRLGLYEKSAG
ncbi:MAG: hypothetical protein HKN47_23375 [Pirellulaceae bacterium]|nr:hypothetical protein [Pirellulaceae bacterium]